MTEPIINVFENSVETRLMALLGSALTANGFTEVAVSRGEDPSVITLPGVVVSSDSLGEAIFQSGIYQLKLNVITLVDVDSGSYAQSAQIFGATLDVLQNTELAALLMVEGIVHISGVGELAQDTAKINERRWEKTATIDLFGYAIPPS